MKKSELIKELYDLTLELEEGDPSKRHQIEVNIAEITFILDHWRKEYEKDETM